MIKEIISKLRSKYATNYIAITVYVSDMILEEQYTVVEYRLYVAEALSENFTNLDDLNKFVDMQLSLSGKKDSVEEAEQVIKNIEENKK